MSDIFQYISFILRVYQKDGCFSDCSQIASAQCVSKIYTVCYNNGIELIDSFDLLHVVGSLEGGVVAAASLDPEMRNRGFCGLLGVGDDSAVHCEGGVLSAVAYFVSGPCLSLSYSVIDLDRRAVDQLVLGKSYEYCSPGLMLLTTLHDRIAVFLSCKSYGEAGVLSVSIECELDRCALRCCGSSVSVDPCLGYGDACDLLSIGDRFAIQCVVLTVGIACGESRNTADLSY